MIRGIDMKKLKVGLYGRNGHQIEGKLKNNEYAELAAVCFRNLSDEAKERYEKNGVKVCSSLDEMLKDDTVELVSLCSPRRADQENDAILCLKAGKHVYAEKPGAMTEAGLEKILQTAKDCGKEFHEYADTIFYEPYMSLRKIVESGKLGAVVQVYAQKSYPMGDSRPQDEETDGGLVRWVGIHALRMVEHITKLKVDKIDAVRTHIGNPKGEGGLYTASSLMMTLENGGVASVCLNYLNPKGFGIWGNECVRVFGTKGMAEITDGGRHTHVYTDIDEGEIDTSLSNCRDFFDMLAEHLLSGKDMPISLEEELHPLRVVIRAHEAAKEAGK